MRLWKADKETEALTEEPLVVSIDGVSTRVAPRRNGASCSPDKAFVMSLISTILSGPRTTIVW